MNDTTCGTTNGTTTCSSPSSSAGLAAGLTIFFLLLVIAAALLLYKFRGKFRKTFQPEPIRSVTKDEYTETPRADPHPYTSMTRDVKQPVQQPVQAPIYENLNTGGKRKPSKQSRSSRDPEEDVYLQCDTVDDAIYSNDPACNLSMLPDSQDEDVYIVPEGL